MICINLKSKIYNKDCLKILKTIPDEKINFIITSPPYADKRGAVSSKEYINWFLPISKELLRVLTHSGSFILNIKENAKDGERSTYVLELILEMRKQGWNWTEEYVWHKKNSFPGKWPNRFRDAWERCLHFTKSKKFCMYQDEVKIPIGDWAKTRLKNLSKTDKIRDESKVKSGFGKNVSNWKNKTSVYPTNVLHFATECSNKEHHSTFPLSLPLWFIKLFTQKGDLVLDPFMGIGTSGIASIQTERHFIGIEIEKKWCKIARENIEANRQ